MVNLRTGRQGPRIHGHKPVTSTSYLLGRSRTFYSGPNRLPRFPSFLTASAGFSSRAAQCRSRPTVSHPAQPTSRPYEHALSAPHDSICSLMLPLDLSHHGSVKAQTCFCAAPSSIPHARLPVILSPLAAKMPFHTRENVAQYMHDTLASHSRCRQFRGRR